MLGRNFTRRALSLTRFVAAGLIGCLVTALVLFVYLLDKRPDLSVWHVADLDEEFTADSEIQHFSQYLALEVADFGAMLVEGATLIDIKSVLDRGELEKAKLNVWRL